ncbi:MAG: single-stranded-DNA-specific exonuclease RecJ [Holosporaceae bacterium]|nr:single-stranded-DNA-specific exonuclease RecJ [Holosporaceae bacterium]
MGRKIVSLTGKVWNIRSENTGGDIVRILAENRGISDLDGFINCSLKNSMPDPYVFTDMEKAVRRIVDAIKSGQRIAILGDYDVDGVSSIALFIGFLERVGAEYTYAVPNRMDEGYGLSVSNIEKHKECLIIAVDCGSNSFKELKYAKKQNIDVIVLDHHQMHSVCEDALIVNPHRPDEKGDYKYLCSGGLSFMCIAGVNRLLRETGFYENRPEPDLKNYLDLAALATVCDVVDLKGLNRALVAAGLKIIRQRKNPGLDALLSLYKGAVIDSDTISFFLGPRLNAAGRMASADLSVQLLIEKDPAAAKKKAVRLDEINRERQLLEAKMLEEALSSVNENRNFICSFKADWHPGVIGILASRLREKYNRPAIVIARDSDGLGKASCRSCEGVDISAVIKKGTECGVIISGGGHFMAGGFSADLSKISELEEFLDSEIQRKPEPPELYADCVTPPGEISLEFVKSMSVLEPFGKGNRHPKFVIPNIKIISARIVGENHIAFSVIDERGNIMRAISFRSSDTPLGDILLKKTADSVSLLGSLSISACNGRPYVGFQAEDASSCLFN